MWKLSVEVKILRSPRCGLYECVHFTRVYRENNESFSVWLVSAIFETARAARGLRNRHTHERTHARTNVRTHTQYGNHSKYCASITYFVQHFMKRFESSLDAASSASLHGKKDCSYTYTYMQLSYPHCNSSSLQPYLSDDQIVTTLFFCATLNSRTKRDGMARAEERVTSGARVQAN